MLKLDIMSDPICPWCFIGKVNLDRALEAHAPPPVSIEWHPFQLNPGMPREGMDRRAYLERKFGGKAGALDVYSQIDQTARLVGIEIDFERITRTPNTMNAHRLIHWAGIEGRQTFMVDLLFRAFFLEGMDIGDIDALVKIAQRAEMDPTMVRRLLAGETDTEDLQAREEHARKMGVNSVPTFILANQAVVTGAQSTQFWEDVLSDIAAQQDEE